MCAVVNQEIKLIPRASVEPQNFWSLTLPELERVMDTWRQPTYRAKQVFQWAYKELADDFAQMSNLPRELRERLAEAYSLVNLRAERELVSNDRQTYKALLALPDGQTIETVLMLYEARATVCVSSQVGCAIGCPFCATGQMGLQRNLNAGEIVEQVIHFSRFLRCWHEGQAGELGSKISVPAEIQSVTNLVFMGMGEPLANYNNLWRAIRNLNAAHGLGMGARRMTVSTSGLVPRIEQFAREPEEVNLAISLHAANDELRNLMVPINKKWPVARLMEAARGYIAATNRRLSYEWALIQGVNDAPERAEELAAAIKSQLCHVNV
ncbi:MAG: 23S rRNA (adenine(2503)-C(2))-methyltransferase RlmN, partial [Candidatus Chloroheliales bacterium]